MTKLTHILSLWLAFSFVDPYGNWSYAQSSNTPPRVALVGFRSTGNPLEERFRDDLRKSLTGHRHFTLASENAAREAVERFYKSDLSDAQEKVRQAKVAFKKGKELYDQLSLDESIALLRESVSAFEDGLPALRQSNDLLMAYLYLGMALMLLGKQTEGEQFMREMIALDPQRQAKELSPRDFPPQITQTHKELTRQVVSGPMGTLNVTVTPPHAKLYLNGAPVTAKELSTATLPVRKHTLVAEHKGYRIFTKSVVIRSGSNTLDITLEPWQPFSVYAPERRSSTIVMDDLNSTAREIPADVLILGSMAQLPTPGSLVVAAHLYDARTQEFSAIHKLSTTREKIVTQAKPMAKALSNQFDARGRLMPELSATPANRSVSTRETFGSPNIPPPVDDEGGLLTRWWFWTSVAGAVGLGVAAYFLLNQGSTLSGPTLQVDNPFK